MRQGEWGEMGREKREREVKGWRHRERGIYTYVYINIYIIII